MKQRHYRLSCGQEQLWFLSRLFPEETAYNETTASRLKGALDIAALRGAIRAVLARNEILRVTFGSEEGVPFQTVTPVADDVLTVHEAPGADDASIEQAITRDATTPLDLEHGPLYRFTLLRLAPDDHVLICTVHHILVDGWSMNIINHQVSSAYAASLRSGQPALAEEAMQFLDYVEQGHDALDDTTLTEQLAFWEQRLAGLPEFELPADSARQQVRSMRGGMVCRQLPRELAAGLQQLAHDLGVPSFAPLVAAVRAVISRYTGQFDLPLGVTMFGRDDPEWEGVVGLFVNMVVLRGDLTGNPTLGELTERAGEDLLEAYEYTQAPFAKVVERVRPARDPNRNPLFQVAVQMLDEDSSGGGLALPGVSVTPVLRIASGSRFDLTLSFVHSAEGLRLEAEYATDLFDPWRVEAMARHIEQVLTEITRDRGQRLSAVALLTSEERDRILALGRGEPSSRIQQPVHAVIAGIAAGRPGLLAATCRGKELTYGELDRRAGKLAAYLRSLGIRHEQVVAIGLPRDLDFLVALLGVLKAGAAYTVIDLGQPAERLEYILRDSGAPVLLVEEADAEKAPAVAGCQVVHMGTAWRAMEASSTGEPVAEWATRDSLIYVLYTSGSTGRPKGVLLEHRALMSFAESYQRTFSLGPGQRLLQMRPVTFDMTHGEIIAALTSGAALVLVPEEFVTSPEALEEIIAAEEVTYVGMPMALLSLVGAGPYPSVQGVMHGGEVIPGELVNKWNTEGRKFLNGYGPTEAAVVCAAYECPHRNWGSPPPIGTPYLDRQLYVVDEALNLVPVGIPGELLVGGAEGLARGYHNQPELTKERFIADPVLPGGRVYRTGDLVRWNSRGELEFLGRRDTQVKVRGHRIELEEIETVISAMPEVAMAAVTVITDDQGDQHLVGYVTAATAKAPAAAELRAQASTFLPAYMIPESWQVIDEFPLNSSKKIDRSALPAPQLMAADAGREFTAPASGTEAKLAEIVSEVLRLAEISVNESLFDIGANSLQAMRIVSRLNRAFGIKVNVRLFYGGATVRSVAGSIDEMLAASPASDRG